jgi:pimeloyl-ACP methyl ester carboxylesterase
MRFVFLHGPGFNTFAERAILGDLFGAAGAEITFWNEPSRLRPAGEPFEEDAAAERWLASATNAVVEAARNGPVFAIGHCAAAPLAIEIARRHGERVAGLVLVTPSLDPFLSLRNVLRLAQQDLVSAAPETSEALGRTADATRTLMDDAMCDGLPLVLQDPKIFTHYWADQEQFAASMAAQAAPEAQFDVDSFFGVFRGLTDWLPRRSCAPLHVPALALSGGCDPIAPRREQDATLAVELPDAKSIVFDDAGHFLHLDRPGRFSDAVVRWARECHAEPASDHHLSART